MARGGGELGRHIEALGLLRDPARERLYRYVTRARSPVTRDEAAAALAMKRSLVAFHLDKLAEAGLLATSFRRSSGRSGPGSGRPSKLYRRSRRQVSVSLPRREHELLASFLAGALAVGSEGLTPSEPARDYGRALGVRARKGLPSDPSPDRLIDCVESVAERLGFAPYREGATARFRSCPFDPLARRFTEVVCGAGLSLLEGVVAGVGPTEAIEVGYEPRPDGCCVYVAGGEGTQGSGDGRSQTEAKGGSSP